jgi:hypothetical protein
MKEQLNSRMKTVKKKMINQKDKVLGHPYAGRVINAITYILVVICLGIWIAIFLVVKNDWNLQPLAGNILTNLTCLVFFGGLVVSLTVGTLIGNFLRRLFWNYLIKREK